MINSASEAATRDHVADFTSLRPQLSEMNLVSTPNFTIGTMAESATPDGAPEQNPPAPGISAAANAYQAATPTSAASPAALPSYMAKDVEMSDRTPDRAPARLVFKLPQIPTANTSSVSCNCSRRIEQRSEPNACTNWHPVPP